jgi:hypothetical protein
MENILLAQLIVFGSIGGVILVVGAIFLALLMIGMIGGS